MRKGHRQRKTHRSCQVRELERRGWRTKQWTTRKGRRRGGEAFRKNGLHQLLTNVVYLGKVRHRQSVYDGEHEAIIPKELFEAVGGRLRQQRRRVPITLRSGDATS